MMMSHRGLKQVDLEVVMDEFLSWQKTVTHVAQENKLLKSEVQSSQKYITACQISEKEAVDESTRVMSLVQKLQSILAKRCDMEVENAQLKEQISRMKDSNVKLEQEHKKQMTEVFKDLEASSKAHQSELNRIQETLGQQAKRDLTTLEKELQEKQGEIRHIQKQLVDLEREKHTEIVKLRLEYDAKLLKRQKASTKILHGQSSTVNNDIFRKKLQHAREEDERQITELKNKVTDLERKLAQKTTNNQSCLKRKRF